MEKVIPHDGPVEPQWGDVDPHVLSAAVQALFDSIGDGLAWNSPEGKFRAVALAVCRAIEAPT